MPITTKTRQRDTITGTVKMAHGAQMVALFGFIGLHELGPALAGVMDPSQPGRRGRKSPYPPLCLLAVYACARVTGSLASALKAFAEEPGLWDRCARAYAARTGQDSLLPPLPPTREQVRYLRDLVIQNPHILAQLQATFRRVALGQAQHMGNLVVGVQPNWADPAECHAIYGDGTHIAQYTDVREVVHPATGEVFYVGSRAKSPANVRIQRLSTDATEDGKVSRGLNMVSIHTWVPDAGRVVLGTAVALKAEAWAAMRLIEEIHDLAGDGVHALIYDRAITGHFVDYLMGQRRVQVIGKAVGERSEHAAWNSEGIDKDVRDTVNRRVAEHGATNTTDVSHLLRRDVIADMLRYHERLPLGLCIYPTSNRNFDLVRGWSREAESVRHQSPEGECVHRVALDDGGLFEVEDHPVDGYTVKTRVLRCHRSTPYQREDGRWGSRSEYAIPCGHGDVDYVRTWEPQGTRYTPDSPERGRSPLDPIGWRLRPFSRADDIAAWYNADPDDNVDHVTAPRPFSDVYSRRNDAESYNEWYQQSLPHHGRAASLDPAAQEELDFLLGALLNNSITWHHRPR